MSETPQRIDKIPDREDLETEIRMLKALCEELREALADLFDNIDAEPDPRMKNMTDMLTVEEGAYERARAALKKAQKDI
jgi:hypothetical protein